MRERSTPRPRRWAPTLRLTPRASAPTNVVEAGPPDGWLRRCWRWFVECWFVRLWLHFCGWLHRWLNHITQLGLLVVAVVVYFWTVLPIYQKERLAEQIAQLEIEKSGLEKETKASKAQLAQVSAELRTKDAALSRASRELKEAEKNLAESRKQAEENFKLASTTYKELRTVVAQSFAYRASVVCIPQLGWGAVTEMLGKLSADQKPAPLRPTPEELLACVREQLASYSSTKSLDRADFAKLKILLDTLPKRAEELMLAKEKELALKLKPPGVFRLEALSSAFLWHAALTRALDEVVKEFLA